MKNNANKLCKKKLRLIIQKPRIHGDGTKLNAQISVGTHQTNKPLLGLVTQSGICNSFLDNLIKIWLR